MDPIFEVFKFAGFWNFRLKGKNGKTVIRGRGYSSKRSAISAIEFIQTYAAAAYWIIE